MDEWKALPLAVVLVRIDGGGDSGGGGVGGGGGGGGGGAFVVAFYDYLPELYPAA